MHITVSRRGTIEVHGSVRLRAHLERMDLTRSTGRVVAALVRAGFVRREHAAHVEAVASAMHARTVQAWEAAVSSVGATPIEVRTLVRAVVVAETTATAKVSAGRWRPSTWVEAETETETETRERVFVIWR